jgi:hypothetical protein
VAAAVNHQVCNVLHLPGGVRALSCSQPASVVAPKVQSQRPRLRKVLVAVVAVERPVTSVNPGVVLQKSLRPEPPVTDRTYEWCFPRVHALVNPQVCEVGVLRAAF